MLARDRSKVNQSLNLCLDGQLLGLTLGRMNAGLLLRRINNFVYAQLDNCWG